MEDGGYEQLHSLEISAPIWDNFFVVAPLVLIGSREGGGEYNQAPKYMAFPMGWDNYFGFVCTPEHGTLQNIRRERVFTVTYPRPTQVLLTSLAAAPRDDDAFKPSLESVPTFAARVIEGRFVRDGYVFLECRLERLVEGFGRNSLVVGQIIAAHVHDDALRGAGEDDTRLVERAPMLVYLQHGRFARVEQSHAFPYPTDFRL